MVVSRPARDWRDALGCALRGLFALLFIVALTAICGVSILFYQYYRIAATLPNIDDLRQRASQFETTRILDRDGNVLYEILDPNAGRRTSVPLSKISPFLVAATIATEDKGYYNHPGFDVMAIVRAFYQNWRGGGITSGASTITQQLARALLFSPEERVERSYERKLREAILAAELTRRYSKDEILELYLNEIYYGNLAYGIEAAAETYFGARAEDLTLAQASFLAGLPQAPAIYDVYTDPESAFNRQKDVLALMYEQSQEQSCIYVSNSAEKVCIDPPAVTQAVEEIRSYAFKPPAVQMRYPHWVVYIRSLLEAQYDPQTIYRSGFNVYTTLDPQVQDAAQQAVSEQLQALAPQNAKDGALVAIQPASGEILAMVGSPDFYNDAIAGQINMAINPRQPGSAIKPLTYLAAFEKGWSPATLIWDVPSEFPPSGLPDDPSGPYVPTNYDNRVRGPVSVRTALANSYNIPAVKALQFVGLYEDPEHPGAGGLIPLARRMGISTLTRDDYGLALTLGGGEVTLLELTSAYAAIANGGQRLPPVAITRILDSAGNLVYQAPPQVPIQAISPEHAYLMADILSDNQARSPAFGPDSPLRLPFPAAVKTGTTNDYRDSWTIGASPDLAVGVWVGNADYTPMLEASGARGAAPVWNRVMNFAVPELTGGQPRPFARPPRIVERVVCAISGTEPSQWCPEQTSELFVDSQPPPSKEQDLWQRVVVDTWTGLRASQACREFTDEKFVMNVTDAFARKWLRRDPAGQALAEALGFPRPLVFTPTRECTAADSHPTLEFAYPRDGDRIVETPLNIYAMIDATGGFQAWQLDFGLGPEPEDWTPLVQGGQRLPQPDIIYRWDLEGLPPGVLTLRLTLRGPDDAYAEKRIRLVLDVPTPTPTPTPTDVPTPLPTDTPWPTATLPPPPPVIPTDTPTPTLPFLPLPSETPTPGVTP